jgi:hypothetical protein
VRGKVRARREAGAGLVWAMRAAQAARLRAVRDQLAILPESSFRKLTPAVTFDETCAKLPPVPA